MNVRTVAWGVGLFGALTAFLLLVGANNIGGIFALFQLGLFVGAPLGVILHAELRSWAVAGVISAALSVALSALSVQFLIWFRVASAELLVVTATAYGLVLALLLASQESEQSESVGEGA